MTDKNRFSVLKSLFKNQTHQRLFAITESKVFTITGRGFTITGRLKDYYNYYISLTESERKEKGVVTDKAKTGLTPDTEKLLT